MLSKLDLDRGSLVIGVTPTRTPTAVKQYVDPPVGWGSTYCLTAVSVYRFQKY